MKKVGLLIQDLASDYSNSIIKGVRKYCLENNLQLFLYVVRSENWNSGLYEYQHVGCKSLATKENVDGIILVTNTYCQNSPAEEHEKIVKQFGYVPVVSFGEKIPDISSVYSNPVNSFRDLLYHLKNEHNCKNIYFMGPESTSKDISLRYNTYKEFIEKQKQSVENRIMYADYTYESAKEALEQASISKKNLPFDAIVCCNDDLAFGCIDYLRENNISVPEDVKVIGFDNQLRCDYVEPSLTSIDLCIEEQCYEAARQLHVQLQNPDAQIQDTCIDSKIVYRHSCGCQKEKSLIQYSESKYFQLRQQVYDYQYFLQDLQVTVETEKIKSLIINGYKNFGIDSCMCCIYDQPKIVLKGEEFSVPEKAKIYFAYNKEKVFSYDENLYLDPKQGLYPSDFSFEPGKEIIVTVLYDHEYQYGYLMYTPGDMAYNTYELIITTTAISLATNIVFYEKVHETEKLSSEKMTLESETYFDEMTGALNRRGLYKYGRSAMKSALERGLNGGVLFGDMNQLKKINDTYGHEAGDRAIKGEVEILKAVFRTQDIIARIGGDEFIIIACGLKVKAFENIKKRIIAESEKYNKEHNEPFNISISLGFVEFNKDNCILDDLMKQADEKQYEEKMQFHQSLK